jgi:hypothetical protein
MEEYVMPKLREVLRQHRYVIEDGPSRTVYLEAGSAGAAVMYYLFDCIKKGLEPTDDDLTITELPSKENAQ